MRAKKDSATISALRSATSLRAIFAGGLAGALAIVAVLCLIYLPVEATPIIEDGVMTTTAYVEYSQPWMWVVTKYSDQIIYIVAATGLIGAGYLGARWAKRYHLLHAALTSWPLIVFFWTLVLIYGGAIEDKTGIVTLSPLYALCGGVVFVTMQSLLRKFAAQKVRRVP